MELASPTADDASPHAAVRYTLDDLLITPELALRPAHESDLAAENEALLELADAMASDPPSAHHRLVELARGLVHADSAGISLLEFDGNAEELRWGAISGPFATQLGRALDKNASA